MSGRGHSGQQSGGPLGDRIKEELQSALKLLFKSVEQHAVDLVLSCDFTAFAMPISCQSEAVELTSLQPAVSDDPVLLLKQREFPTKVLELIDSVQLAADAQCEWESVLCSEPVFAEMKFESVGVSFDNMMDTNVRSWPVQRSQSKAKRQTVDQLSEPTVKGLAEARPLTTRSRDLNDSQPRAKVKSSPRFYALPIRKASIPPHRFSAEVRARFRQALAEKAGTQEGNVQLKMIFERMNMGLFSNIQADEAGNLLCTPKPELLGKGAMGGAPSGPSARQPLAVGSESSYLVLGVRLDNQADIRALVPVESVLDAPDGKAGA